MKTDFSINVKVNIGLTPEVAELVKAFLSPRQTVTAEAEAEQVPAADSQVETATAETAVPSIEAEPAPVKAGPTQAKKELTEEDVRAAMRKTRQRIEGENYKTQPGGDAYVKYHKALTAEFKNIAALMGADKPSALPAEQRASFIEQCDQLQVMADGTIGLVPPF